MAHLFRTILTIVLCLGQASYGWAQVKTVSNGKNQTEKIELKEFSGKSIAGIFAATCSEKNWAAFAKWAEQSGFVQVEQKVKTQVDVNISAKTVSVPGQDLSVKILPSGSLEAHVNGKTYQGEDSCAIMTQVMQSHAKTGWSQFILPSAFAENLVSEDRFSERRDIGIGIGLAIVAIAGVLTAPATSGLSLLATAGGAWSAWTLVKDANNNLDVLRDYEDVLGSEFHFSCDKNSTKITAGHRSILVTKGTEPWPMKMVRDDGVTIHNDYDSKIATESKHVMHNLALKCDSQQAADELNKLFHDEKLVSQARLVALNRRTPMPSKSGPVQLVE